MANLLGNAWVQVTLVPLLLLLVGVFARRLGRRDGDKSPRGNDWAVGTTLLLMVLGTILGDIRAPNASVTVSLMWLIGVLCTAFLSLDHDRYRSWKRDAATGVPTEEKRIWVGIIFPDILCLCVFGFYQAQKVNLI